MTSDKQTADAINLDLTGPLARLVIYLEGKSDPPLFSGLLGIVPTATKEFVHQKILDESLALFDGKWLLRHFLVEKFPKAKPDGLCQEWITHAATSGGLPEVCDLWQRITGSPP